MSLPYSFINKTTSPVLVYLLKPCCWTQPSLRSVMACPFLEEIVDEGAALLRRELRLRGERTFRPRLDVLSFPDQYLLERYRFSSESIVYLHELIKPHITNVTHRGRGLSAEQTLCVALRFFSDGSFYYNVGDSEQISKSTACRAVRRVCLALKGLLNTFVVFPGHKPVSAIKEEFEKIAGIPEVIGCIGCTHIPILAPSENEVAYLNKKSIHSINVQIACDASNLITDVEAKWPGSVDDSKIYQESLLSNRLEHGEFDGHLLGDGTYPCQPTLLTPYLDPKSAPQQRFNMAHYRTRACLRRTIGLLKARFKCLHHLRVAPERACDIILACVVLHNIATIRGEEQPEVHIEDQDEDLNTAKVKDPEAVRDIICRSVFSETAASSSSVK